MMTCPKTSLRSNDQVKCQRALPILMWTNARSNEEYPRAAIPSRWRTAHWTDYVQWIIFRGHDQMLVGL
jgi:hypothetical protein